MWSNLPVKLGLEANKFPSVEMLHYLQRDLDFIDSHASTMNRQKFISFANMGFVRSLTIIPTFNRQKYYFLLQ